jgi:hypothetical protein
MGSYKLDKRGSDLSGNSNKPPGLRTCMITLIRLCILASGNDIIAL